MGLRLADPMLLQPFPLFQVLDNRHIRLEQLFPYAQPGCFWLLRNHHPRFWCAIVRFIDMESLFTSCCNTGTRVQDIRRSMDVLIIGNDDIGATASLK